MGLRYGEARKRYGAYFSSCRPEPADWPVQMAVGRDQELIVDP